MSDTGEIVEKKPKKKQEKKLKAPKAPKAVEEAGATAAGGVEKKKKSKKPARKVILVPFGSKPLFFEQEGLDDVGFLVMAAKRKHPRTKKAEEAAAARLAEHGVTMDDFEFVF